MNGRLQPLKLQPRQTLGLLKLVRPRTTLPNGPAENAPPTNQLLRILAVRTAQPRWLLGRLPDDLNHFVLAVLPGVRHHQESFALGISACT